MLDNLLLFNAGHGIEIPRGPLAAIRTTEGSTLGIVDMVRSHHDIHQFLRAGAAASAEKRYRALIRLNIFDGVRKLVFMMGWCPRLSINTLLLVEM